MFRPTAKIESGRMLFRVAASGLLHRCANSKVSGHLTLTMVSLGNAGPFGIVMKSCEDGRASVSHAVLRKRAPSGSSRFFATSTADARANVCFGEAGDRGVPAAE